MKLTTATATAIAAILGLVGLAAAQLVPDAAACPTATKTMQNRGCHKVCQFQDCAFVTTIQNPCGCPAALPTATLIAPCEADCPYGGCDIDFRTAALPCPTTPASTSRSTTRHPWPPSSTPTLTSTSSPTQTSISIGVTTLPPKSSTPCPTIVKTTSPAECPVIRCPVPTCIARSSQLIPCGCTPKTLLYVTGCATACPTAACATRVETISALGC
ncbi:hypothetical protein B0T17DRAFT_499376 [Bombardia bombarda]|uniref:Uncharacterized protein n=1 Tax=Bombardia bombarda TaxID=252184 RepID=A0AA39WAN2_9PEZI|nr:hypothetical protein B0T17DRAFT_499376 [Bombardia bombarda]